MGPGVAVECCAQKGLHIAEDYFLPELIDPKTGKHRSEGEKGELVLTNLNRDGMPIIRFRTKDITSLDYDKCECGRTFARMARITGRSDDMLKVKGVAFFPSQIEKALLKIENVEPHYQIIVTRPKSMDEIEVKVEASPDIFFDEVKEMIKIRDKIEDYIENEIGLRVKVSIVEPKTIPRSEGKAVRVIDKRDLH
jgi:phenylacetate-CoA ligase